MHFDAKIYVAGHKGLVGSAIMRLLQKRGYKNIITQDIEKLDLRNQQQVHDFFKKEKPDYVFLAAAKVGGIKANASHPASFIYDNLMIEANVIHTSWLYGVKKLLFLGSSCIYPRTCPQPIKEEYLLTDSLESTNEAYAIAKIAGLKMCAAYNKQFGTNFISCMPTNLYGPFDNFDLESSHVIPALIAKLSRAQQEGMNHVSLWGTGKPLREFLFVDDLADGLLFLMDNYYESLPLNIGMGDDITIHDLAHLIKEIVGYTGAILFNENTLDGTPQKKLDCTRINQLGWKASTLLEDGLKQAYEWYKNYHSYL